MKTPAFLITLSLLLLLLLPAAVAESCAFPTNLCDSDYPTRAQAATGYLRQLYTDESGSLMDDSKSVPLRYPATLFYLGDGTLASTNLANQLLAKQLKLPQLSPLDGLYLAWSYSSYKDALTAENQKAAEAKLAAITVANRTSEEEGFLQQAGQYLYLQKLGSDVTKAEAGLAGTLRQKGNYGWLSEADPPALAGIVVGLAAVRSESRNATLKLLAEMNLDLIFSRFAALDSAGAFGGVHTGDTIASGLYDPRLSPWYGWSFLLLGTPDPWQSFAEPGLLRSGYCANDATRALLETRQGYRQEVREVVGGGYASSLVTSTYVLSGAVDLQDHIFAPDQGYVTRASVRFNDDPYSFILFTTSTSNTSDPDGPDSKNGTGLVYTDANRSLIIGRLGGSECREPHVFLGRGFEHSSGSHGLIIIHHLASDQYFALRFDGGQQAVQLSERYAPLAAEVLPLFDGERGEVIYPLDPSKGGVFAFEQVPNPDPDLDIDSLEAAVMGDTSLMVKEDGTIVYESRLHSGNQQRIHYDYISGQAIVVDDYPLAPSGFAPRRVRLADGSHDFLTNESSTWSVSGELGGYGRLMTLDLAKPAKSATEGTYGCGGSTATGGTLPLFTDEERVAFLAASLLKGAGGSYVLECGDPTDVFPSHENLDPAIVKACVLSRSGERIVGIIYDPTASDGLPGVVKGLNSYFPFQTGEAAPPNPDICKSVADNPGASLDFTKCGEVGLGGSSYDPLYLFLSPQANALIISSDPNPSTTGFLDSVMDFFRSLFSASTVPATNPAGNAPFAKAYLFKDSSGKEVRGRVTTQGEAVVYFLNFSQSVQSLVQGLPGATYIAGGRTQEIDLGGSSWRLLAARLRVVPGGAPKEFIATCNDGILEYGEECDKERDGAVVTPCPNSAVNVITCTGCKLDSFACSACVDYDKDGYNESEAPACGGPLLRDCNDQNKTIHPGAPENCTNAIDDNCNGVIDGEADGCVGTSTPAAVCSSETACGFVCNVTLAPSGPAGPCAAGGTAWVTAFTKGSYTFEERVTKDGLPQVRVTPAGACKLGNPPTSSASLVVDWRDNLISGLSSTLFNDGAGISVSLTRTINGWDVSYAAGANAQSRACWSITSAPGTSGKLGRININDYPSCVFSNCTSAGECPEQGQVIRECITLADAPLQRCIAIERLRGECDGPDCVGGCKSLGRGYYYCIRDTR